MSSLLVYKPANLFIIVSKYFFRIPLLKISSVTISAAFPLFQFRFIIFQVHKKVSSTLQLPLPLNLEGIGVSFFQLFIHNRLMNILQRIFTDYYEEIKYTLHPRSTEMENIDKMINCGDPSFGGAMYGCPHCGKLKFVPFRCHSRFCPTCGNKYSMERTTSMSFKLVNVQHRHCVFTIDENLRDFFLEDRTLLDCLFHSVTSVVSRMFFKMNKSKNYTPGFIMVLHTFGRDLNGIPTSTVLYRKVVTVMMDSGVRSTTSIILICVMLSAQHCLMKWDPARIFFQKNKIPVLHES